MAIVTVAAPSGATEGRLLLAQVGLDLDEVGGDVVITPPSGWTLIRSDLTDLFFPDSIYKQALYYKVLNVVEPSSYDWDVADLGFDIPMGIGIVNYANVDPTNPVHMSSGNAVENVNSVVAPALNTTNNRCQIIGFFGSNLSETLSVPSDMTQRLVVGVNAFRMMACGKFQALAGSTGTKTSSITNPAMMIGQLVALNRDPAL